MLILLYFNALVSYLYILVHCYRQRALFQLYASGHFIDNNLGKPLSGSVIERPEVLLVAEGDDVSIRIQVGEVEASGSVLESRSDEVLQLSEVYFSVEEMYFLLVVHFQIHDYSNAVREYSRSARRGEFNIEAERATDGLIV